jgi:hypothetical protein
MPVLKVKVIGGALRVSGSNFLSFPELLVVLGPLKVALLALRIRRLMLDLEI